MVKKDVFQAIIDLLNKYHIDYRLSEHIPVRTSEEAAKVRGVELKTGAKAMVIKAKGKYYLVVLPADRKINWKKLKAVLQAKEIRLATVEEAENITGLKMGSVPPFGNVLGLESFMDPKVLENEWINFNPGSLTHSISMKSKDLAKLIQTNIVSYVLN